VLIVKSPSQPEQPPPAPSATEVTQVVDKTPLDFDDIEVYMYAHKAVQNIAHKLTYSWEFAIGDVGQPVIENTPDPNRQAAVELFKSQELPPIPDLELLIFYPQESYPNDILTDEVERGDRFVTLLAYVPLAGISSFDDDWPIVVTSGTMTWQITVELFDTRWLATDAFFVDATFELGPTRDEFDSQFAPTKPDTSVGTLLETDFDIADIDPDSVVTTDERLADLAEEKAVQIAAAISTPPNDEYLRIQAGQLFKDPSLVPESPDAETMTVTGEPIVSIVAASGNEATVLVSTRVEGRFFSGYNFEGTIAWIVYLELGEDGWVGTGALLHTFDPN
jgi:hypothetical protein